MNQTTKSLFAAAQAAWPEDEAALTFDTFVGRLENAQDNRDRREDSAAFLRDMAHMRKVFGFEADAAQLIARYDAAIAVLFKARHKDAFASLSEYAAEDAHVLFELTPLLDGKTLLELVAARRLAEHYVPNTIAIDELVTELNRFAP